jgi:hypothetical protein
MNIWIVLGMLSFLAIWMVPGYRRAKQIQQLIEHGQSIQGVIVGKRSSRGANSRRRMIVYEYTVDGRQRQARTRVSAEQFAAMEEGQLIAVRFLPDQPEISAPEFVVEQGRQHAKR